MKFRLMSDIHLEFNGYFPDKTPQDKDTTLLLAGDVHVGTKAEEFLIAMCKMYKNVVYILGNHEAYHHDLLDVQEYFTTLDIADNFHFLEKGSVTVDDVTIFGATLWTSLTNLHDARSYAYMMNDYNICRYGGERMRVEHTYKEFLDTIEYFRDNIPKTGKNIVMTHHAPLFECVNPKYAGSELNRFFTSNLEEFFTDNYKIDTWVHGHMHDPLRIVSNGTKVICEPRGYPRERTDITYKYKGYDFEV